MSEIEDLRAAVEALTREVVALRSEVREATRSHWSRAMLTFGPVPRSGGIGGGADGSIMAFPGGLRGTVAGGVKPTS